MLFVDFSALYSDLYREAKGRTPYAISIRRAYNRIGFQSPEYIRDTLTKELA